VDKVTKATAKQINDEIKAQVTKILAKHNMEISNYKGTYGDLYSIKIDATTVTLGKNGVNTDTKFAQEFLMFAFNYGVGKPEQDLGEIITVQGKQYIVCGLNIRKKAKPVLIKCTKTGDEYFAGEVVLQKLPSYANIYAGLHANA
jgi:hypothetical protein